MDMHPPNKRASNKMKQKLTELKEEIKSTIIDGDFDIPLSVNNRTRRQKIQPGYGRTEHH